MLFKHKHFFPAIIDPIILKRIRKEIIENGGETFFKNTCKCGYGKTQKIIFQMGITQI